MGQRVLLVRHEDDPDDDRVTAFVRNRGLIPDIRRPYRGESLGEVTDDVAGLVIFGGMYNAYDTDLHPFLKEEYRWIEAAMGADLPVLGLCQGVQMLAHAAGAWVGAPESGVQEFGYYEIQPVEGAADFLPGPLTVLQAHFHTFDLPAGAQHLARSALFENQAFRLGPRVHGLQFHPETTPEGFRRWQDKPTAPYGKPGVQRRAEQDRSAALHDPAQAAWFDDFLARLFPGEGGP